MTDGERQVQQLTLDASGPSGAPLYDAAKCSNSEETSPSLSVEGGGNGYVWEMGCTSPSSAAAASLAAHQTNCAFTNNASLLPSSSGAINIQDGGGAAAGSKKDDTMQSTSSEASTDTFYTPSASLQNIPKISKMIEKNRKLIEFQEDDQKEMMYYDEQDEMATDSGAVTSTTIPDTVTETPDSAQVDEEGSFEIEEATSLQQQTQVASSSETQQQQPKRHKKIQQHKRQSSAGSQCSLSSNPENSQFKTADANSSDSDVSRNSGSASGIFDSCSGSAGGVDYMREESDRRSLQSDYSHSGEQLHTSVESVESGTHGDVVVGQRSEHTPRKSVQQGASGSSSVSPPQGSQISTSGGKPRVKKKMWYQQIFSTSYKTRSGDFKKIFKDLPLKERLIVDYSCALQKDILIQGRMYVSQNYVSFYANIFGWETQTSISFKEIESITKEKTALIIPNAVGITTMTEKFFFSSFVTRDTTYLMLFKLWQAVLLDDSISKKELWGLVHTCYGEELGVTSEDESEDMFCPPLVATSTVSTLITTTDIDGVKSISIDPEATPEITVDKFDADFGQEDDDDDEEDEEPRIGSWEWCRLRGASPIHGLVCGTEIGPAIAVGLNIGSSIVTSNGIPIGTDQLLVKDANIVPLPVSMLPMNVEASDSSDTEAVLESDLHQEISSLPIVIPVPASTLEVIDTGGESAISIVPPVCPVDHTNYGKEILNTVIPCNIDHLFTSLFTSSKFYLDFQTSRKTFDMNQCEWQLKDGSHKTRQLSFTVFTGQSLGPKTSQVTETQTLLPASRPGLLYAIQSESVNAGIPYADAFSIHCHYCLTKLSPNESNMTVIGKIHYKKSVWAKAFIEKNAMSGLADYMGHLERALKEECAKSNAGSIIPSSPVVLSSLPRRRHPRKKCRAPDIPATALTRANVESSTIHQVGTLRSSMNTAIPDTMSESTTADAREGSLIMKIILTVLGCLLLLNAFLYFKLSSLETSANLSVLFPPAVQFSGEAPQTHEEWLTLLQQQETLHRSEVQGWHEILISAIKILHQAENDLENLKSHISTYGSGSVIVKPISRDTASDLLHSSVVKSERLDGVVTSAEVTTATVDAEHTEANG